MMTDIKTSAQLKSEIAYYAQRIKATTSPDRQRRAHTAIRRREALLVEALKVEAGRVRGKKT